MKTNILANFIEYLAKPLAMAGTKACVNAPDAPGHVSRELRSRNEHLQRELRERMQAEEQLRESLLELELFTYSVPHELRAPLRAISGFASVLAQSNDLNEHDRQTLDKIIAASGRMDRLIHVLLSYARNGQRQLQAVPVALEPLVQQIATTFQTRIHQDDVQFEIVRPLATPAGDPALIEQILTNLIDNALTYRSLERRPRVSVAATCEQDHVVLSVRDNGIGVAPEYQQKIFQAFQRLHRDSEYAGTGIGLAIVAKSARMMHGSAHVSSEPNVGSTFSVSLPKAERSGC